MRKFYICILVNVYSGKLTRHEIRDYKYNAKKVQIHYHCCFCEYSTLIQMFLHNHLYLWEMTSTLFCNWNSLCVLTFELYDQRITNVFILFCQNEDFLPSSTKFDNFPDAFDLMSSPIGNLPSHRNIVSIQFFISKSDK